MCTEAIHVKLCSSRALVHLVPLPSISSLLTQKSMLTSASTKFSSPFSKKYISRLLGKDANFDARHHDSARVHMASATVQWLENFGYNYISARNWPANSLDLSPIDFSVNGIFKLRLWKRKARNVKGLKSAMRQKWSKVTVDICV